MTVTPFQCLFENKWPAAAQFGELSPELERPEGKNGRPIDFPGQSRATRAEDGSGPVVKLPRPLPLPSQIGRHPLRKEDPDLQMRIVKLLRDLLSRSHELGSAAPPGPPAAETCLPSKQRARPIR